ncbi:MAG: RHS repeat protein [candidate division NC10 bacterium]|nr:RHS repeat protein [candidate division NC10 bacterium]
MVPRARQRWPWRALLGRVGLALGLGLLVAIETGLLAPPLARAATRVSIASDGTQGNNSSDSPSISADGRYVAFESFASNLVGDDSNGVFDIFVQGAAPNRTAGCSRCPPSAAEPIQTGTGEYFIEPQVDLNLGGPLSLFFSRTYASRLFLEGEVQSNLGPNWMHNFDIRLKKTSLPARKATVVYERGNILTFQQPPESDEWVLQSSPQDTEETMYQLREGPNREYWFMDPNRNLVYRFWDAADTHPFGRLREMQDRNGNTLSFTYDDSSNLTQVIDGLGRTLTLSYDASGNLTQLTDGERTLTYTSTDGVLTGFTDALGHTTMYLYDTTKPGLGPLLVAIEQPLGNRHHTQTYDAQGRVIQQVDALGNPTTLQYDTPAPGSTTITDALGRSRTNTQARERVLTEATDATGQTSTFTYDANDRPTEVTDRLGHTTATTYDPESGLPTSMIDAQGNTGEFTYTPQEQTFGPVTFTFHKLVQINYPDGARGTFSYDPQGNLIQQVDRVGNVWTYTYDARGQLLTTTNPLGGVATYTYNADGTLASTQDSETGVTTYEYDSLKRLTRVTHPDGTFRQMTYDFNDRLVSETDENGGTISFTYDANGNVLTRTDPAGNTTRAPGGSP